MNTKCTRLLKSLLFFALHFLFLSSFAQSDKSLIHVTSPDGNVTLTLTPGNLLQLQVLHKNTLVVPDIQTALVVKEFPMAYRNAVVRVITTTPHSSIIKPVLPEKRSIIPDNYTETEVWFKGGYGIKLRAYNDGVAWRMVTRFEKPVTILDEILTIKMNSSDSVYYGSETSFISHSERFYPVQKISEINKGEMCILPALFKKPTGLLAIFTESDLLDYPGLYLQCVEKGEGIFTSTFPKAVQSVEVSKDRRSYLPSSRYDFIASTTGVREYPWRVFGIATNDVQLIENDIVYRLASPCKLQETDWIKPGKVAWDWWNDWNLKNVPFKAGINTDTYKFYIDFASKYNLEYVIFDEGWSANDDLEKINPEMDMDGLFDYAKQKNVKIILWVTGRALEDKFESSLDKFQKWGCAGIKMDFMVRDDQQMVNFYEKVATETAKRHMLADFHGSYKPTGLSRTFPNQLTREGVRGLENCKWSNDITPIHDCTLPFTRMFAGPMDYTPGAMRNSNQKEFRISNSSPMSMGTRCHELAKYIIFESPLQMLCDAPSNYLSEELSMRFIANVPTVWDETHALNASISRFLTIARRSGDSWYIGSMTDWSSRDFELSLSFLTDGKYKLQAWFDGPNTDKNAEDFLYEEIVVDKNTLLPIHLSKGGGYVCRISKF